MALGDLPPCPFIAGPMIMDPRLFVGRRGELARLTAMAQQPVSANVVGERRIGKSSLLYHFFQTWEQRVRQPDRYCVVYLNLQDAHCDQEHRFYQAVLQALRQRLQRRPTLGQLPQSADRSGFSEAMGQCRQANVLPVLCLDEFESLFEQTQEFGDRFFDNLRALMNSNQVMLILASRQSLDVYKKRHRLTSDFFNLGQIIRLGELEPEEVNDLVRLPASTVSNLPPALGALEQSTAKKWGEQHPCKLQHAANFLWQAGQQGYDKKWAWKHYKYEIRRLPKRRQRPNPQRPNPLRALKNLGRLARNIGDSLDDFGNLMTGAVIVVVVLLGILGVFQRQDLKQFLDKILGG